MAATPHLEFEKDIVEIQEQIQKLLDLANDKGIDVASELGELRTRLERLKKSSGWDDDQLARFYDRPTIVALLSKVMAFRLMHLHGRLLPMVLPQADGSELLWEFGGLYHHDLVRTEGGWRSARLVEELSWKRGL